LAWYLRGVAGRDGREEGLTVSQAYCRVGQGSRGAAWHANGNVPDLRPKDVCAHEIQTTRLRHHETSVARRSLPQLGNSLLQHSHIPLDLLRHLKSAKRHIPPLKGNDAKLGKGLCPCAAAISRAQRLAPWPTPISSRLCRPSATTSQKQGPGRDQPRQCAAAAAIQRKRLCWRTCTQRGAYPVEMPAPPSSMSPLSPPSAAPSSLAVALSPSVSVPGLAGVARRLGGICALSMGSRRRELAPSRWVPRKTPRIGTLRRQRQLLQQHKPGAADAAACAPVVHKDRQPGAFCIVSISDELLCQVPGCTDC
jgi:hypothetical protein